MSLLNPASKGSLMPSFTAINGKLMGFLKGTKNRTWVDCLGVQRLDNTPNSPNAGATLPDPDKVPDTGLLTNEELMSLPIHAPDGSVVDPRKTLRQEMLDAAVRTRRDLEAVVVAKAKSQGILPRVAPNSVVMRDTIHRAVTKALDGVA